MLYECTQSRDELLEIRKQQRITTMKKTFLATVAAAALAITSLHDVFQSNGVIHVIDTVLLPN